MITTSGRPISLVIDEYSMVGEVRRAANALAGRLGFDDTERGKVAIAATEAATNLAKHAPGGEIVIQGFEAGDVSGLDILGLDRGPGMLDVERCLVDGYSTAGSPGTGLGAMSRLSSAFDLHSLPGSGTATFSRHLASPAAEPWKGLTFGALNIPLAREEVCGDSWAIKEAEGRPLVLVVDGLGHGPQAAEAARKAVECFAMVAWADPAEFVSAAHEILRSTRGAAVAVAQIDRDREEVRFVGVGNIAGVVVGPGDGNARVSMVSHNGTVGHTVRKVQQFVYRWAPGSMLVMHSDGASSQWQLNRYSDLRSRHPGVVAGVIYRDFKRVRDDVTVLVAADDGEERS